MLEMEFLAFDDTRTQLHLIHRSLDANQLTIIWNSPHSHWLNGLRHRVSVFETEHEKPFDWQHLENWLADIAGCLHGRAQQLRAGCQAIGRDIDDRVRSKGKNQFVQDCFHQPLMIRRLQHEFGPNWRSCYTEITLVLDSLISNSAIPLSLARKSFREISGQVLQHWLKLRDLQHSGRLELFRDFWEGRSVAWRRQWLQRNFPFLHEHPHAAIHQFLELPSPSMRGDSTRPLWPPLLNLSALSRDSHLPSLLDARCCLHPKLFLSQDAEFVALGIWAGRLPRKSISGKISLSWDLLSSETEYGLRLEDDAVEHVHLSSPRNVLLELQSQERTYRFLVLCAQTAGDCIPKVDMTEILGRDRSLTRNRLDFGGSLRLSLTQPNLTDWDFVKGLLQGLLDEVLDELRHVRTDAAYWLHQFQGVRKSGPGRTLNLLTAICHRIGIYEALCTQLVVLEANFWDDTENNGSAASQQSRTAGSLENVINFRVALRCILNESLASLKASAWSFQSTLETASARLLGLMTRDEPVLRVMGLHSVMEIVDAEIASQICGQTIPGDILHLLHTMSAVSICAEEVDKHMMSHLRPGMEYLLALDRAEDKWTRRHNPCKALLKHTKQWTHAKRHQLDDLATQMTPIEYRHQLFWSVIDTAWVEETVKWPILTKIMSETPISVPQGLTANPAIAQWALVPEESPTRTQLRRSRRHPVRPSDGDTVSKTIAIAQPPERRPARILIQKVDQQFWHDLLHKAQGSSDFSDFSAMLQRCGYKMYSKTGSARRFELHVQGSSVHNIVFHEPHPSTKLSNHKARGEWSSRMLRHVEVDMA